MPHASTKLLHPRCPRCNYDLSGITSSWQHQCPTTGQCQECGLTFEWTNIFNDNVSPGFIEVAERFTLRAALRTGFRALRPWYFWHWVRIEARIAPIRMLRTLVTHTTVTILLLGILPSTALALYYDDLFASHLQQFPMQNPFYGVPPTIPTIDWIFTAFFAPFRVSNINSLLIPAFFTIYLAAIPALYTILATSFAHAKVRQLHVIRIAGYCIAPLAIPLALCWPIATVFWAENASSLYNTPTPHSLIIAAAITAFASSILILLWPPFFYAFANAKYLRIKHPISVALLLPFTAFLTAVTVFYLLANFIFGGF